jgi:hypothetical protein
MFITAKLVHIGPTLRGNVTKGHLLFQRHARIFGYRGERGDKEKETNSEHHANGSNSLLGIFP